LFNSQVCPLKVVGGQLWIKKAIFINCDLITFIMTKIIFLLIFFAIFFAITSSQMVVFAQNQSLASQLSPPPKTDPNVTRSQNQSGQLQIQTGLPEGDATPLGWLGKQQQPPQSQQQQNQTNGPLEQLGKSVGKLVGGK
jgi:hypothetical protein